MSNQAKQAAWEEVRAWFVGLFLAAGLFFLAPSGCEPNRTIETEQAE